MSDLDALEAIADSVRAPGHADEGSLSGRTVAIRRANGHKMVAFLVAQERTALGRLKRSARRREKLVPITLAPIAGATRR